MARSEIRVSGLGGQGVILCATIIGKAASIYDGRHSTMIQSFGPEARGSACSAQLTIDDDAVGYPYVKKAGILIALSPDAYNQFVGQLKPGGILIYESELVKPDARTPEGVRAFGIPATRIAEEVGRRLVLNIVMVGFFASVAELVSHEAIEKAVRSSVPRGTEELNLKALQSGYQYGLELMKKELVKA
jgi:2-oxoglutarate ferredoxin oxidoreductase subunit gamma